MITTEQQYQDTRQRAHPRCRLCGPACAVVPSLDFHTCGEGSVAADFSCGDCCEGYNGIAHGGITAAILDSAMCNAVFSLGHVGVTARLELRFRDELQLDHLATVSANVCGICGGAWQVKATINQDGRCCVSAQGMFMAPKETA